MKPLSLLLSLALALFGWPALAGGNGDPGLYGQASVTGQYFRFKERLDGSRLVRERGLLPGGSVTLGWQRPNWFLDTHWSYQAGEVDHDGQTNQGIPLGTRTRQRILDGLMRLGWWQQLANGYRWSAYTGAGYRHWDRKILGIRGVGGLDEAYQWPYAALGLTARKRWARQRLSLDLRLLRPVGGELTVDFDGAFDTARLDLEGELGGRLSLTWDKRLPRGLWLRLESWYEHWELGRSNTETLRRLGAVVGGVFQPASETDIIGLSLGIRFGP